MSRRAAVLGLLLALFIGGCTTTIIPPPTPANPATVYVTDYGRHSSLLLPESGSNDRYVEYAFGDWDWFAEGHKISSSGVHALFFSKDSALGRRELTLPHDENLAGFIHTKQVEELTVPRERANALREELDAIHQAHIDTKVFNQKTQLWFVKYSGGYGLCHNCNHATADWLRQLGCTIRGTAMCSRFRVKGS